MKEVPHEAGFLPLLPERWPHVVSLFSLRTAEQSFRLADVLMGPRGSGLDVIAINDRTPWILSSILGTKQAATRLSWHS